MKRIIYLVLLFPFICFGQSPQGVNYQAVAYDANGFELSNKDLGVRISIVEGSAFGTPQLVEEHDVITTEQGLFSIIIGQGDNVGGTAASLLDIPWGSNTYFLKIELDTENNGSYMDFGTQQFMSVPYALYAESSNILQDEVNQIIIDMNTNESASHSADSIIQADVDANEADSDSAIFSIVNDLSLMQQNVVTYTNGINSLITSVTNNELDSDAADLSLLINIDSVQADVHQNELNSDIALTFLQNQIDSLENIINSSDPIVNSHHGVQIYGPGYFEFVPSTSSQQYEITITGSRGGSGCSTYSQINNTSAGGGNGGLQFTSRFLLICNSNDTLSGFISSNAADCTTSQHLTNQYGNSGIESESSILKFNNQNLITILPGGPGGGGYSSGYSWSSIQGGTGSSGSGSFTAIIDSIGTIILDTDLSYQEPSIKIRW